MDKICLHHSREEHEAVVAEIRGAMPTDAHIAASAELFKAFADLTRVKILTALVRGEVCVCDIADSLGMTQSAISHQLRFLKNARLIKARREGKMILYSLADSHVTAILALVSEHIAESNH